MARGKVTDNPRTANMTGACTPAEYEALKAFAEKEDTTPSRIVRKAVLEYLAAHGVKIK